MAALPYIQLYIADYLADTAHLNAAQHGAYLLLIFNYWQRGKPLDNRNERLANVARMSNEEWQMYRDDIAEFFVVDGDTWSHPRIDADLAAVESKSTKNSEAGKASAAAKKAKSQQSNNDHQASVQQSFNERSTDVQHSFNHTDTDTDVNLKTLSANASVTGKPDDLPVQPEKIREIPEGTAKAQCPAEAIVALYHELMPDNPRVKVLDDKRRGSIRARWKQAASLTCQPFGYSSRESGLAAWRTFFEVCAESDFLTGKAPPMRDKPPFVADIDFLMSPSGFAKCLENKYHRDREAA
jgi:uncharacterized protein YdaU (DUF1376 family)